MFCHFCKEYYEFKDETQCDNKKCYIVQSFIRNNGINKMADIIIKTKQKIQNKPFNK
jgi:hypothetical protein